MKSKLLCVLNLMLLLNLAACSGDEGNVEVSISSSAFPLIPASAVSCLADKNAGASAPVADVSASYFRVPTVTFNRKNTASILVVALLRINIAIPGSATKVSCDVGGDTLLALNSDWWAISTKEALVPAGTTTFTTDCPLYCGGIKTGTTPFIATGTLEVFGLERNPSTLEEVPVKIQTTISIQNY